MPLRRIIQYVKHTLSTSDYTFTAPFNKGYEIVEIGVNGTVAGSGANIMIDGVSMLYVPGTNGLMEIGAPPFVNVNMRGFLEQVRGKFPQVPILRIAPGQTLTITPAYAGGTTTLYLWFREYTSPEVPVSTDPGGSDNVERLFVSYGVNSPSIAAGATEIEGTFTVRNPSGYLDFPFSGDVPPDRYYDFLGLVTHYDNSGSGTTTCNGIRIWEEDESILAPGELFAPIDTFPMPEIDQDRRIFLFDSPIRFSPNESIRTELEYTNGGAGAESPIVHVGMLFHVIPV